MADAVRAMAKPPAQARRSAPKPSETLRFLLKLALVVLIFRSFVLAPFSIPSRIDAAAAADRRLSVRVEMELRLFALVAAVGRAADAGRILAARPRAATWWCSARRGADDHDVIKRVIGLPGDTVQMRRGQLILNGQRDPEAARRRLRPAAHAQFRRRALRRARSRTSMRRASRSAAIPRFRETLPDGRSYDVLDQRDDPGRATTPASIRVPAGHVFLMGDNRDDSADSRFAPRRAGMGYIPMDRIEGKALVTFFSTDGSAAWLKPWTWFSAARPERIGEGF